MRGPRDYAGRQHKDLAKRLFDRISQCCDEWQQPLNAHFYYQTYCDILKELNEESIRQIKEDPVTFVQNASGVLITDSYCVEGYEAPSVISLFGTTHSGFAPTYTENNFCMRSIACLVIINKK